MALSKQTELEVKGQCRIGIMKIHDTLSHGDKPMCQIWYNNVKVKKTTRAKYESAQTDGWTNGQTNKRMEKVITIYPLNFIPHGRYKNPFLFQ